MKKTKKILEPFYQFWGTCLMLSDRSLVKYFYIIPIPIISINCAWLHDMLLYIFIVTINFFLQF